MEDLTKATPIEETYKVGKFLAKSLFQFLPPGFSGTASEFFDLIDRDPSIKRRDRFLMELAARLESVVENQKFDPAKLIDNDAVSAFLLHAIQIAQRTRGEQKLSALREVVVRGTIAEDDADRAPGYVVMGIIDRFTDYHLLVLRWEAGPKREYTGAQLAAGHTESLLFGHPVERDPKVLKQPRQLLSVLNSNFYVEQKVYDNAHLAHADLVAMGLLVPVLMLEQYLEGRHAKSRLTPEIVGYQISDLGKFVVKYIEPVDGSSV